MFAAWGSFTYRFRWAVLTVLTAAVVGAGGWGLGVFDQLTEGGYHDPGSESARAAAAVQDALGPQGGDIVVVYTPQTGTVDDPAVGQAVTADLAALPRDAVTGVTSYWQTRAPQLATGDRRSAVAVLTLAGDDDSAKIAAYRQVKDSLTVPGVDTAVGGGIALQDSSNARSKADLARAEMFSLPIVLILLVVIFGSLVAAALPVLVGSLAVLGSLGVLHAEALTTEVNSFAVNVASLLGLGMAIDYGLFMVGRFREELAAGHPTATAVRNTVATAGRTVVFSATLLIIALAGLLLFPQEFLRSLSYGGTAAVALAALISLTLLPALLGVLGPRVDRFSVRRTRETTSRGWDRLARFTMRRPAWVALPIAVVLLLLAAPVTQVNFGELDERVLPRDDAARRATETIKADFPAMSGNGVRVVLTGGPVDPAAAQAFADRVGQVDGVAAVTPGGTAADLVLFT
ncbi:MAG TPA: efflux RND transporter permease subunit, partial [Micromonospora sp.]